MLVIFSNRFDPVAKKLCEKWSTHNARMLTCSDLSKSGWRFYMETKKEAQVVIDGEIIPEKEIKGIVTLWPAVYEQELTHIAAADRFYVANEMTAFLKAWLTQIPCPVLNRPSAVSLVGPGWRVEKWVNVAAQSGLTVAPIERQAELYTTPTQQGFINPISTRDRYRKSLSRQFSTKFKRGCAEARKSGRSRNAGRIFRHE